MIRPATRPDLPAIARIERGSFATDRLSPRSLRTLLSRLSAALVVATHEDVIVGYALTLFRRGSGVARLYSIAVAPEATGRGVGGALLEAAEREAARRGCRVLRLELREDNAPAAALYGAHGYRRIGTRARYYEDGMDARRLEKPVGGPRRP